MTETPAVRNQISSDSAVDSPAIDRADAASALTNLLAAMRRQREQGAFSTPVEEAPHSDVGRIAAEYNRVMQRVEAEFQAREQVVEAAVSATEKFRSIFENSVEGIFQTTLDGQYLSVNPALARIYGYDSPETLMAELCNISRQLYVDPDRRRQFREALEARDTVQHFESQVYRADGRIIWIAENALVIRDSTGNPLYYEGTVVDITERKEQERKLLVAQERAEQANHAKSAFLANMSHEIRTPMTAILGYADILLQQKLSPEAVEAIGIIQRNGEHLLEIINSILDLSKIEAGRLAVESIASEPCRIVADIASFMRVRAASKGLRLAIEFRGPVPERINSDPTRLRQILINLVGNAIKFTELGEVRLVVGLVDGDTRSCRLQFDIVDTGIGMTAEELNRVFEPFMQADVSTTRLFGGTGLGLSICRRLAEMLGGTLTALSSHGEGSKFTLTLPTGPLGGIPLLTSPAEAVASVDRGDQPVSRSAENAILTGRRILLAEDGPDNQRLISHILRKAGAIVEVVDNGQLAVETALRNEAEGHPFDSILMDVQMPILDGHCATRQLRERGYHRPIIAVTAHAMKEDRLQCLAAGCDEFVTKPVTRRSLVETIANVLADTGAPRAVVEYGRTQSP